MIDEKKVKHAVRQLQRGYTELGPAKHAEHCQTLAGELANWFPDAEEPTHDAVMTPEARHMRLQYGLWRAQRDAMARLKAVRPLGRRGGAEPQAAERAQKIDDVIS